MKKQTLNQMKGLLEDIQASAAPASPGGLLITDLQAGMLYRCRLSHRTVLVVQDSITGPMSGNPLSISTASRKRGYVFNAVYGVCQYVELVDRQLEALTLKRPEERQATRRGAPMARGSHP
jgi:hypothetical protein